MRSLFVTFLIVLVTGCTTIARSGYEAATDERSLVAQKADTQIALTIKKNLVESGVRGKDLRGWRGEPHVQEAQSQR